MGSSSSSLFVALVLLGLAPRGAVAQGAASSREARVQASANMSRVSGRVVKPGGDSIVVVPHTWVTLHRVGPDRAGPLDSTRTSGSGHYDFRYTRSGSGDALYFVSSSYGGVAYFTQPLPSGDASEADAEIVVFDTTSRAVPVSIRGRHVIVSRAQPGGGRTVTEVFDLSNDSSLTRVAHGDSPDGAVWASILPAKATRPNVADGDVPPAAVRFADGRALIYAPMAPGMKQLVYSYTLPDDAFPLTLPLERATSILEVLLEEPAARVEAPGLRQLQTANVDGRQFRRFLAQDVPAGTVMKLTVPETSQPVATWLAAALTLVIGGAMTWALARALRRR